MAKMVVRAPYAYDADAVSLETGLEFDLEAMPSKTHQSFKEECDINVIMERFGLTGDLPSSVQMPVSGDFTEIGDFGDAMRLVRMASEGFMQFPADVRARFGNDPVNMIAFLENPENVEEARKLGLVNPKVIPPRDVVTAVDELAQKLAPPGEKK